MSKLDDRLRSIEARLNAATPGPWADEYCSVTPCYHVEAGAWPTGTHICEIRPSDHAEANSDFIANAPTDIAFLLAEVKRLEAENAELKHDIEKSLATASEYMTRSERLSAPVTNEEITAAFTLMAEWGMYAPPSTELVRAVFTAFLKGRMS